MCSLLYALFASAVIATPLGGDNVMKRQGFDGPVNPGRRQIAVGTVLLKMRFSPVHTLKSNGSSLTTNLWPGKEWLIRASSSTGPNQATLAAFHCRKVWMAERVVLHNVESGGERRLLCSMGWASHLFTSSGAHSGSMLDFSRRL
ncbi:hypothetical protein CIHG_06906 [Coccidioides immitis H538.4]|uniref:Secreted protein n=3 Tax=Coccidioides immitis TaxID=5501 RepID=A0A0J8R078_COCIT|nr:hypothetical protein CIRG_09952 [Coccidioides immitis RMSCC 2394]KMU78559.1 hypothetical protein CISG_07219 [Coccidioides immitis RMSCC 3703]KMU89236.1 hypothetical protein CIHG_06906 [Coccidioides immitis H538.4]